ncbi:MAG: DUF2252 domain-containing protein [Candidatus Nanopelagicales bacterium]
MTETLWVKDGQFPDSYRTVADRKAAGKQARRNVPRSSHAGWTPAKGRRDPVALLEEQNADRLDWLVPIRHARMRVSPFTFYRGTARIMASDLADSPVSGLSVQLGGDAHLSNFGAYASSERHLVFDANDFDETLLGPWEWDLKRLAASFVVAGQHLGLRGRRQREAAEQSVMAYRQAMASYTNQGYLDIWYDYLSPQDLAGADDMDAVELRKRLGRFERKARSRTSLQAMAKLTEVVDGKLQIRSDPPLLVPLRDLADEYDPSVMEHVIRQAIDDYKATLSDDRRELLDRFVAVDIAVKVVGVGSVGTRCLIILFVGRDEQDPLFLQVKEAGPSVLAEFLQPSKYDNQGRRVVEGQRLAQAQSDIFLGWTQGREGRQFYVRQLRDWKGSVEVEGATPEQLSFYATLCGRTLARGHARSGDPVAISAYAGKSTALDRAITDFAVAYSEQNQRDYEAFLAAIDSGRLPVSDVF